MNKKYIFTVKNQIKGEDAMNNNLNKNALSMYDTGILKVYEYEENGNVLYATKGAYEFIDITFEFLEEFFTSMYEDEMMND